MGFFWFGALCGGAAMLMTGIFLGAQIIDEKDEQIKYLKQQLYKQAKEEKSDY